MDNFYKQLNISDLFFCLFYPHVDKKDVDIQLEYNQKSGKIADNLLKISVFYGRTMQSKDLQ